MGDMTIKNTYFTMAEFVNLYLFIYSFFLNEYSFFGCLLPLKEL